jgi:hypothetical protein
MPRCPSIDAYPLPKVVFSVTGMLACSLNGLVRNRAHIICCGKGPDAVVGGMRISDLCNILLNSLRLVSAGILVATRDQSPTDAFGSPFSGAA